jgi:hypothetical protein
MLDQIFSYREMCDAENIQTLQRGMNYRLNPSYSVVLMSRRSNAPYKDRILSDGITIEYEGHDASRISQKIDPKSVDQPKLTKSGNLTQNGHFIAAVDAHKAGGATELVKVYEKMLPGVWSLKGFFNLVDYKFIYDGNRYVYKFILKLSEDQSIDSPAYIDLKHTRLIPSEVKREVWQRDKGKCVLCGSTTNLHFDHDLPFSKGGTSVTAENIRILCATHNLAKSDKLQ